MKAFLGSRSVFRFLVAALLSVLVPACQAQQSSPHLDRHARKIQRFLTACPAGSHVRLTLRNQKDEFGYLGDLSAQAFELLDPATRPSGAYLRSD